MHIIIFIFAMLCSCLVAQGQGKKLVLQIDTLINENPDNFWVSIQGQSSLAYLGYPELVDTSIFTINNNSHPNFICPLTLENDTSAIRISWDNAGGYLEIANAYNAEVDTIRIDYFVVHENCYPEITFTEVEYFEKLNDSIVRPPYEVKQSEKVHKKKCRIRPIYKTSLVVNDQLYLLSVQQRWSDVSEVMTFHGYSPRRYNKRKEKYKGKVTYFHGVSQLRHRIDFISLSLKHSKQ